MIIYILRNAYFITADVWREGACAILEHFFWKTAAEL